MVITKNINRKGAAMIEGVLIIPVLLLIFIVVYQIHRIYTQASNAAVVARTEIILYSLAINCSEAVPSYKGNLFDESHPYTKMFPESDFLTIEKGAGNSGSSMLEKIAAIATISTVRTVKFRAKDAPIINSILGKDIADKKYAYSGVCAIEPLALNSTRFFNFLSNMLTQTGEGQGSLNDSGVEYDDEPFE